MTSEERTRQLERMFEDEEKDMKMVQKEVEVMRGHQFKQQRAVHELKQKQSVLEAAIQGTAISVLSLLMPGVGQKAAGKNLSSKIKAADAEALQQATLLYQQDFQVQV